MNQFRKLFGPSRESLEDLRERIGDANDPGVLEQARARYAREIICVTPNDETNVRIAMRLRALNLPPGKARPEGVTGWANWPMRKTAQLPSAPSPASKSGFSPRWNMRAGAPSAGWAAGFMM